MLDSEQAGKLRTMISTAGWNEVVKPWIANRGKNLIRSVLTPKAMRAADQKEVPTNFLRGRLEEIEWMLSALDNELKAYDANQRRDELDRQTETPANP